MVVETTSQNELLLYKITLISITYNNPILVHKCLSCFNQIPHLDTRCSHFGLLRPHLDCALCVWATLVTATRTVG